MKVLVTGCAGFIGSRVSRMLLDADHTVVGVDDLNDAYDVRLKHWRMESLQSQAGFSFQRADIADREAMTDVFQTSDGFDAVVNLAARAGVRHSVENPWIYMRTNAEGTLNLLDLCRRLDVPRFLVASTSSLYGNQGEGAVNEDASTERPLSPYAASKKAAESMSAAYHHLYGMHVMIPRYFTVYGPGGRPDMSVFRFIRWIAEGDPITIYGDGSQRRDFTYVDDIARGTLAALGLPGLEVLNLGGSRPVPLSKMIKMIEANFGRSAVARHLPMHVADVKATWADNSKARRLLDWEPTISLEQGIAASVAWYKENRAWAKDVDLGTL